VPPSLAAASVATRTPDASTAAGSITKVILASSIVAIMWDWWERGRQHVYTGACSPRVCVCACVCVWWCVCGGGGGDGRCLALQVLPRAVAAPRPAASSTWPPAAARRPWTDAERLSCAPHRASEEDWTLDSSVAHNCYAYCKRESERLAYELAQGQR
jgi:hypothetical protein